MNISLNFTYANRKNDFFMYQFTEEESDRKKKENYVIDNTIKK